MDLAVVWEHADDCESSYDDFAFRHRNICRRSRLCDERDVVFIAREIERHCAVHPDDRIERTERVTGHLDQRGTGVGYARIVTPAA